MLTPAKLQELAREAGLTIDGDSVRSPHLDCVALGDLARFAALVRAAVLEEAARVCDALEDEITDPYDWPNPAVCADAIRALAQQAGGEAPPC